MKCEDDYYLDHETELCVKHEEPEEPIDDEGNCKEGLFFIEEKNLCVTKKVCEVRLGMMAEEIWDDSSMVDYVDTVVFRLCVCNYGTYFDGDKKECVPEEETDTGLTDHGTDQGETDWGTDEGEETDKPHMNCQGERNLEFKNGTCVSYENCE